MLNRALKSVAFGAMLFAALEAVAAVADVHQWQLPSGFYNAGVRQVEISQTGNIAANGAISAGTTVAAGTTISAAGTLVPVAPTTPGVPSTTQLNLLATVCTLTDAGVAGTPKCAVTVSRNYIDGGAPICDVKDPNSSTGVTFALSNANATLTVSGGAAGQYGDPANIICVTP